MQISAFWADWHGLMFFNITPQNWHGGWMAVGSAPFGCASALKVMLVSAEVSIINGPSSLSPLIHMLP
jgi:hypothetical protein